MNSEIEILKGIHPGLVLERKLQERGLKKGRVAIAVHEFPQTITDITKGRRGMNTALSLKLEQELGLEEGFFMTLQVFYEIKKIKEEKAKDLKRKKIAPELSKFRPALFWDTDINKIDWERQYKAVIKRVLERGNDIEKAALKSFYGDDKIQEVLNQTND